MYNFPLGKYIFISKKTVSLQFGNQEASVMFYYKKWDKFCRMIRERGFTICTAEQSLKLPPNERFVVLKHDVETAVPNAYRLASIERFRLRFACKAI